MTSNYNSVGDPTTSSLMGNSSSDYYARHCPGTTIFPPSTRIHVPSASTSSSPFKPTAALSHYSPPSAIVCSRYCWSSSSRLNNNSSMFIYLLVEHLATNSDTISWVRSMNVFSIVKQTLLSQFIHKCFLFTFSIKPFSPSSTANTDLIPSASTLNSLTTRFISSNRMKLVEFAGYVESKREIDSVSRIRFE